MQYRRSINLFFQSLLLLWCLIIIFYTHVNSTILSGTGSLVKGGWDFSEATTVHPDDADIFIAYVVDPPLGDVVATNYALVLALPGSVFEDLQYAPADSSMYSFWAYAVVGLTYVVITRESNYAKFQILELNYWECLIEYVYQPDGSRVLYDTSPVEEYSWGKIKALYR